MTMAYIMLRKSYGVVDVKTSNWNQPAVLVRLQGSAVPNISALHFEYSSANKRLVQRVGP